MILAVSLAFAVVSLVAGQEQGLPRWMPSEAKDMYGELDTAMAVSKQAVFGEEACEIRTKLAKSLGPVTGPEKPQMMNMVLSDLGICELKKGKTAAALRRYEWGISELNAPSEDSLLQNPQTAVPVLMKDACKHIMNSDISRAAVELRRARTIHQREKIKMTKMVAKQNKVPAGQEDVFVQTVLEKSKEGGQEAQQVKGLVRLLNSMEAQVDSVEAILKKLDDQVVGMEVASKDRRGRLTRSLSAHYAPALLMESVITSPALPDAETFTEKASVIAKEVLGAQLTSTVSLLKRTKEASGCKKLPKTCEVVKAMPDLSTNGFGESRILILKAGKRQALDLCDTNANFLLLLPLTEGVNLDVGGGEAQKLEVEAPVIADHCVALGLQAEDSASVLIAQAWHPEFATIERTTEVRDRAAKWGLKEDEVKELTKAVNAHGKKGWEKAIKAWQAGPVTARLRERAAAVADKEQDAKQAKQKADTSNEEDEKAKEEERKKALEELEQKRLAKKEADSKKERERIERKKMMEAEAAKKDPWLLDPAVKKEQQKLEDLKQERRDANSKLEFDLTKSLTKEINEQERFVAKTIKKAKKAWKKGKTLGEEAPAPAPAEDSAASTLAAEEKRLAALKEQKAKAVKDEDFDTAKKLKKDIEMLEKVVAALRAKTEL